MYGMFSNNVGQGPETLYRRPIQISIAPAAPSIIGARSSDELHSILFSIVNPGQFMQFHVTCCLLTRLLTNNMARKSITYWHCCCKPSRPLFMRLVNLTYQLLHYIYIHFRTGFFLAMFFSVWDTGRCNTFFEGAVTRMTILGSHVTDQIPSPKFRSWLYRRSLCGLEHYSFFTTGISVNLENCFLQNQIMGNVLYMISFRIRFFFFFFFFFFFCQKLKCTVKYFPITNKWYLF